MSDVINESDKAIALDEEDLSNENIALDLRLGRAIKYLRLKNGLSQKELAIAADTSSGMLQRIENGKVSASLDTLANIADAFGMSFICVIKGARSANRRCSTY